MPRLNYVNRKSEGPKLGAIVAKDLRKRVKPPSSSKGDVHRDTSPLEINLEGKNLTDEGLAQLAQGLLDVLDSGVLRLHALHINQNGLTARSLAELAPCIGAAAEDLEELDLSTNCITIKTVNDENHWGDFLESFKNCRSIRRLDVSNNALGDSQAFDIFSRVYLRHFKKMKLAWENERPPSAGSVGSENGHSPGKQMATLNFGAENTPWVTSSSKVKMDSHGGRARGLPVIRSIVLDNVSLKDWETLFLSYVLQRHHWVHTTVLADHGAQGTASGSARPTISLESNDSLQATGIRMLKLAEMLPYSPFPMPNSPTDSPLTLRRESLYESPSDPPRRISGAETYGRRVSESASTGIDTTPASRASSNPQSPQHELDKSRRKLQRVIIQNIGVKRVALWSAALKFLAYTRPILIEDQSLINFPVLAAQPKRREGTSTEGSPTKRKGSSETKSMPTYASRLQVNRSTPGPVLSITGESSKPATPHVSRWPTPSATPDQTISPLKSRHRSSASGSQSEVVSPLKGAISMAGNRDVIINGLPKEAWRRIFSMLGDPHGVLSPRQQGAILIYGAERPTLAEEVKWLGKQKGFQIWRVLEAMGCLFYDEEA